MKVKSVLIKLLVSILIILTLTNVMSSTNFKMNYSFASDSEERVNELMDDNGSTGIIGSIINFFKNLILAPFRAMRSINYALASSAGATNEATPGEITPFDIFFNHFTLLDANIFSTTDRDGNDLPTDGLVYQIRTNTAMWYYAIRTIAISIIAIMLIWNLIRSISKSTSADQKVIAKNALTDWVLSFTLVMFMHIIIIVVLNFNDVVLSALEHFTPYSDSEDFFDALENAVFAQNFVLGVACLVVYALLNFQTLKYILIYIQRFLTIVLLVMISPIIPVTYSTDRMRGGRGAALNGWLKELLFNVFVQVLHAIVYAALVGVAMAALTATSISNVASLAPALMAVAAMLFIKYAEKMVKTIFGFDSSQIVNTNLFANAATTIGNVASSITGFGQGMMRPGMQNANAGSAITFGKNINGGQPGIGQVAQGVGQSLGRGIRTASNSLRGIGGSFMNGIRGADGANGLNGEASARAEATATASVEGNKENEDATATATAESGSNGRSSAEEMQTAERQDARPVDLGDRQGETSDEQQDAALKSEEDLAKDRLTSTIMQVGKNTETKTSENTETVEEETIEQSEETHEETHEEVEKEPVTGGVAILSEEAKADLMSRFREEVRAVLNDDKTTLDDWAAEVKAKIEKLEGQLDDKTKEEIIDNINKNWDNDAKIQEYIKSLAEGSKEREYAEAINDRRAQMILDNESDLSKEEKLSALISAYNAKGLEIPQEVAKVKEESELDRLLPPSETKPKEEMLEAEGGESGVVSLKDAAVKNAQKALLKLGVKVEDETELQSDFQARYEETASKVGMTDPTLDDVISSLSPSARREYEDYQKGRLALDSIKESSAMNAIALEKEATAIRMIANEARQAGFEMDVEHTRYEGTVNMNGTVSTFYANSSQEVIQKLYATKNDAEKNKKKLA